jgi:hypothetical protein
MPFTVIYDANVLYPNTLRDPLIRIAQQPHLVQAKWTDQIIDETLGALQRSRPDITEEKRLACASSSTRRRAIAW